MEFSVEASMNVIYDKKTKAVFKEVISSYNNKNYRSAMVMLYTVVVCDLIYKMQDLNDMYQDEKAEKILNYIMEKQQKEKNSSMWEENLIKKIGEETELLSSIEVEEILSLKKYRNLAAHPVLRESGILYVPTKELTLAEIRAMVEAVLSKPPLLSKKIIDSFLNDLSTNENIFVYYNKMADVKALSVFLKTRYFRFMGNSLKKTLFKDLWKLVFVTKNEDCEKNRTINFYALECLYGEAKEIINPYIKEESKRFLVEKEFMLLLYEFLLKFDSVYDCLGEDVKVVIDAEYKTRNENTTILSAFLKKDLETHCKDIIKYYDDRNVEGYGIQKSLKLLYDYSSERCKGFRVLQCYIEVFSRSNSYNDSEVRFRNFVLPYIKYMEGDEISLLINSIKKNRQIYESHYVIDNLSIVEKYAKQYLGEDYSIKDDIYKNVE